MRREGGNKEINHLGVCVCVCMWKCGEVFVKRGGGLEVSSPLFADGANLAWEAGWGVQGIMCV